jgi:hypothetical protein
MRVRTALVVITVVVLAAAWLWTRRPHESSVATSAPAKADGRWDSSALKGQGLSLTPSRISGVATDLSGQLSLFSDADISIEERRREIARIAASSDPSSIDLLEALGSAQVYLSFEAVEALGSARAATQARRPEVAEYLRAKLDSADAVMACAAVRGLSRLEGADAVPSLIKLLEGRREGYEEMVEAAVVDALGDIGSPQAVATLVGQLARSEEPGFNLEQGSRIVRALGRINADGTASAAGAYAERLAARVPEDPLAKPYMESKLTEAQALARSAR